MHRSSDTIGKIAAALALAQRDLQNPEKSQLAALPASSPQETPRSFRYASLAAGLDIIRKTLGEHEIATVQSTSLDRDLGLIRLNTVLAHSSGEWIASDWPVCPTNDVGSPHRLGAALTYARRYALFTIVGIAGEDDLDAPDLAEARTGSGAPAPAKSAKHALPLAPDRSATLRDQLLTQLADLKSLDDLTLWTLRHLKAKSGLQALDAEQVDQAYLAKLRDMEGARESPVNGASPAHALDIVPITKTVRRRNKSHLAFVAAQPCMVCRKKPCDAHHLKYAQPRALGRKVSDEFTVPLCREHHAELHRHGNERAWWVNAGLAPLERAAELWDETQRREAEELEAAKTARQRAS